MRVCARLGDDERAVADGARDGRALAAAERGELAAELHFGREQLPHVPLVLPRVALLVQHVLHRCAHTPTPSSSPHTSNTRAPNLSPADPHYSYREEQSVGALVQRNCVLCRARPLRTLRAGRLMRIATRTPLDARGRCAP